MDAQLVCNLYVATKLHFCSPKYDIFQYKARVKNVNINDNGARRAMSMRVARKFDKSPDVIEYFVSQYAYGDGGGMFEAAVGDDNYNTWENRKVKMTSLILDDLYAYCDTDIYRLTKTDLIYKEVSGGRMMIESAVALNNIMGFAAQDYFVYARLQTIIKKLARFVKYDKTKLINELEIYAEV